MQILPLSAPGRGLGGGALTALAAAGLRRHLLGLYDRAARVGYNTDEGQAVWPSQYFQFVFLEGKVGDRPGASRTGP